MTPYQKKMNQLLADAMRHGYPLARNGAFIELRQHIEQGSPDCRTCEKSRCTTWNGSFCNLPNDVKCINFSQYKRADYTPLCEVTK